MGCLIDGCAEGCLNFFFPILMFDALLRSRVLLAYLLLHGLNIWLWYSLYQRLPQQGILWIILALVVLGIINSVFFFVAGRDIKAQIRDSEKSISEK